MKLSLILIRTTNPKSINKHNPVDASNSNVGVR